MKSNFSFQVNTNISNLGGKKTKKKGLTPQEEYWLNRILRDHSVQIFLVAMLFLILMIVTVVVPSITGNTYDKKDFNLINISK